MRTIIVNYFILSFLEVFFEFVAEFRSTEVEKHFFCSFFDKNLDTSTGHNPRFLFSTESFVTNPLGADPRRRNEVLEKKLK